MMMMMIFILGMELPKFIASATDQAFQHFELGLVPLVGEQLFTLHEFAPVQEVGTVGGQVLDHPKDQNTHTHTIHDAGIFGNI